MILQSQNGEINLLAALPQELNTGSMQGIRARGGFVVDLSWENGLLKQVRVFSRKGEKCKLRLGEKVVEIETEAG